MKCKVFTSTSTTTTTTTSTIIIIMIIIVIFFIIIPSLIFANINIQLYKYYKDKKVTTCQRK